MFYNVPFGAGHTTSSPALLSKQHTVNHPDLPLVSSLVRNVHCELTSVFHRRSSRGATVIGEAASRLSCYKCWWYGAVFRETMFISCQHFLQDSQLVVSLVTGTMSVDRLWETVDLCSHQFGNYMLNKGPQHPLTFSCLHANWVTFAEKTCFAFKLL